MAGRPAGRNISCCEKAPLWTLESARERPRTSESALDDREGTAESGVEILITRSARERAVLVAHGLIESVLLHPRQLQDPIPYGAGELHPGVGLAPQTPWAEMGERPQNPVPSRRGPVVTHATGRLGYSKVGIVTVRLHIASLVVTLAELPPDAWLGGY
jgi:hypothetical protein